MDANDFGEFAPLPPEAPCWRGRRATVLVAACGDPPVAVNAVVLWAEPELGEATGELFMVDGDVDVIVSEVALIAAYGTRGIVLVITPDGLGLWLRLGSLCP